MDKAFREALQQAIDERFECQRCGHCCKGDGQVRFGPEEARGMADHLKLNLKSFLKEYTLKIGPRKWMLKGRFAGEHETGAGHEQWCVFLFREEDGRYGCRVNQFKPEQRMLFPDKWRNTDSFKTCAGLRLLKASLMRERRIAGSD
jgi:Fe-S-cluster containining protein